MKMALKARIESERSSTVYILKGKNYKICEYLILLKWNINQIWEFAILYIHCLIANSVEDSAHFENFFYFNVIFQQKINLNIHWCKCLDTRLDSGQGILALTFGEEKDRKKDGYT